MRFESASSTTKMMNQLEPSPTMSRKVLLEILLPWLYNIELVEVDIENEAQSGIGQGRDDLPEEQDVGCPLRKPGWGSKQATHIVLNNLLSITQEVRCSEDIFKLFKCLCKGLLFLPAKNLKKYAVTTISF